MTTYFVGAHYEVTGSQVTKYYFAGSQRIAMTTYTVPQNPTLRYLLTDHLGSTSLVTDPSGGLLSRQLYKAWGETRYTSGVLPTKYTYTGQYSYASDFGLHFYNARWYDSLTGRFAQADTIVPAGMQGLDRYAYVNNSPLNFVDPTGHFTRSAIYGYLYGQCLGEGDGGDDKLARKAAQCATSTMAAWEADTEWWDMITAAQAGDVLFGSAILSAPGGGTVEFGFTFQGTGTDFLTGITPSGGAKGAEGITLFDIQQGHGQSVGYGVTLNWMGIYRRSNSPTEAFPYTRLGYEPFFIGTPSDAARHEVEGDLMILGILACAPFGSFEGAAICGAMGLALEDLYIDLRDLETGDFKVKTGPIYWNFQLESGNSGMFDFEGGWWENSAP